METEQTNNLEEANQTIQTPIKNPVKTEEKPKKNFSLIVILSFATIIASLIAAFFYFQNAQLRNKLQNDLPSPTPTIVSDEISDWKTYTDTDYQFSFKYPKEIKFDKDSCISLQIVGPTQTNDTEPFDGLYLSICPTTLENQTLDSWIESILSNAIEIIKPKTKVTIKTYEAYSFEISGELMTEKQTVIQSPILDSQIISIVDITKDPTNQGYKDLADKIISTFEFIEIKEEKINCISPRPEACTMECIVNPPYICGSDFKSYCTVCQACANKDVEWYEITDTPCKEK